MPASSVFNAHRRDLWLFLVICKPFADVYRCGDDSRFFFKLCNRRTYVAYSTAEPLRVGRLHAADIVISTPIQTDLNANTD